MERDTTQDAGGGELLRIGELARRTRTGKATVEHYLKLGLLEPFGTGPQGYRLFGPDSLGRIALLRKARLAGFGLPEIRSMFLTLPLHELDELLTSLPPLHCREELRGRGVAVSPGVA